MFPRHKGRIFAKMNSSRLLKSNIDSLLVAILGMMAVLAFTKHGGLGISPDSIYYISASHSVLNGQGFYQFDDQPFILFPLFYPSILALIQFIFRQDINLLAPYMNALLFGLSIFISGCILEKINQAKWLKWILLLAIAASPSLLEIYTMLWSEALFILEVLLFIWVCFDYFKTYSHKHLVALALVTAIAFETRLAGVTLAMTGALLIILSREIGLHKKVKHFFIFGCIACSLISINLIRNYLLSASLTGTRQKGATSLVENVKYYGTVLSDWMPFEALTKSSPFWMGLIFLLSIFGIFIYRYIKKLEHNSIEKIAAAFTLVYSIFMLLSATFSKYETINNRLLAPFFIPCLFTLSFYMVSWVKLIQTQAIRLSFVFLIVIIGGVTLQQYYTSDKASYQENNQGGIGGYGEDDWVYSTTIAYIKKEQSIFNNTLPLYSNASHAVYFFTGKHLNMLPETAHVKDMAKFNQLSSFILIWFKNEDNPALPTLEEVKRNKNLTLVKALKDGYIFQTSLK